MNTDDGLYFGIKDSGRISLNYFSHTLLEMPECVCGSLFGHKITIDSQRKGWLIVEVYVCFPFSILDYPSSQRIDFD